MTSQLITNTSARDNTGTAKHTTTHYRLVAESNGWTRRTETYG